ncbi:unnamed protein product [Adineta steineri]|uniref:Uncharacterized protein n=1 Tax=Adineta steineri TaxID=433720 RepID=A0A819BF57_9BILA|nr:unnamed protein product [Adineta steineri]CAF3800322.1 unnamed protein product [Adineta steineri]
MATTTRQLGRQATRNTTTTNTNTAGSDSGVALSPSSTGSTATPPRRYILDIPTSRTRRSTVNKITDEYDDTNVRYSNADGNTVTYSNAITSDDNIEELSRSGSREYYYRDGESDSSNRYVEDGTARRYTSYMNTVNEDQEVQALTEQATPDIKNYPINVDTNPELIVRPNTQRLTYTQDIAVRYLKPGTPPPPGPIIIREVRAAPPPPAPPIILRQRPPPPRTPSPVIIREKPPSRPKSVPTTIIKKVIPPPPPPPRKLIIERLPKLPPKPRPVIIERWLPYHKQKRQVIHEKAKPLAPETRVKNTIIEWRPPEIEVVKHVKKLGISQADPQRYHTQHGDKLYTTEFVQRKLTELGLQEELALMQEQQSSVIREDNAIEQTDEYNVRQILNGYNRQSSSSRQNNTITRLIQSSSQSGILDDYDDQHQQQQMLYERSPNNSQSIMYETNHSSRDGISSNGALLTEEVLLRSHANSGGKFPAHLLTKLGSHIYDMPSEEVDFRNNERRSRTTTTTTARYYTENNDGGINYESPNDETSNAEERYVRVKASDLKDVLANYEAYNSTTGERLEGEQLDY